MKDKTLTIKQGKALIKKLGLMPPNKLTSIQLAYMFDTAKDIEGLNTVGNIQGYLGYSKIGKGNFKIALIGKGVTFDSGGISIKPSKNMHLMKFDMLGAATSLVVSKCITNDVNLNITCYGVCDENLPYNEFYRPGDIKLYKDGTKVEIINTDAEGRLLLAEGILEAKEYHPDLIITIATLTGAAKAALGPATAIFSNEEGSVYQDIFISHSRVCNELIWPLPIWDIHRKAIKAKQKSVADIINCSDMAGASTAASFLEHFVGETPWFHLDIAGSAYNGEKEIPTGICLEPLVNMLKELGK